MSLGRKNGLMLRQQEHTLDNSLLNTAIGMSIGWGIAYRNLLTPSIGVRICRSIPIACINRSREIGTIGYCSKIGV